MATRKHIIEVDGHRLSLSNLDKVLYPTTGFLKGQVIDYYARIAPVMLPHLKDRPVTLKRYPDGVESSFFFEKNCPGHRPRWVSTATVRYSEGESVRHCLINERAALVWVANLAAIELHTSLARAEAIDRPTMLAFDLDPGPPASLRDCLPIALRLHAMFDELGLQSFPKTSGGKGLHVYVPLNTPTNYDASKQFAYAVALTLEKHLPDAVTSNMSKAKRTGKVFVDWSQNSQHKTTVCVYSLRAQPRPTVSAPVTWEEIEHAVADDDAESLVFEAEAMLQRVEERGDLFAPVLNVKQKLPDLGGI